MMRKKGYEIDPDEILLDSSNIPRFDTRQFEGRLDKPISKGALYAVGGLFALCVLAFFVQAWNLEAAHGGQYLDRSRNNLLRPVPIFGSRGAILDRNGTPLAWNVPSAAASSTEDSVPEREYATTTGLAHALGYVQYPSKDKNGFYYQNDFSGVDGVEKYYNDRLTGENGSRLVEANARGDIVSENVVHPPQTGETITLSIDSRVQSELYESMKSIADQYHFSGGAGVIMDVHTGELLALTSYPEYSPQVMSDKTDTAAVKSELNDPALPFLDRAVDGLYTPGSIVKPYIGMGVLNEHVIDPATTINDTGSISIPNPYDPTQTTVFRDWKALGVLDFRHAIAMSSDVYFYTVGGGYQGQKGLGIANIDKYLELFGLGEAVPDSFTSGPAGLISSPAWKQATFNEPWYLGDTYHTTIGQYGTQVTPVQIVRAMGSIANEGTLLVPTIEKGDGPHVERTIDLPQADFDIVHQGMRLGVEIGTSVALNVPFVDMAGKSGTAELGASKANVNSWITGFWPYEDPHYAFAVMLEHGSVHNLIGAAAAMRATILWMGEHTPEYFK
jgi:penicillin-binding protein 2